MFFNSLGARFATRTKPILDSLTRNVDLVDRDVAAINAIEAKEWRTRAMDEAYERDQDSSAIQQQAMISWLKINNLQQEDALDAQLNRCHPNSCS